MREKCSSMACKFHILLDVYYFSTQMSVDAFVDDVSNEVISDPIGLNRIVWMTRALIKIANPIYFCGCRNKRTIVWQKIYSTRMKRRKKLFE